MNLGARRLIAPLFSRPWPLHPFLAPFPPLLSFLHGNRTMSDWTQMTGVFAGTWAAELVLLVLLTPILRSVRTAAAIVSLSALVFFSHYVMRGWDGLAWAGIGALTVFFAVRPRSGEMLTTFGNLLAVIGVVMPLVTLYSDETRFRKPRAAPDRFDTLPVATTPRNGLPDVVYIVVDGYGGPEVLWDRFGYDSPLPAALEARGFVLAPEAHSNYIQTALSFAATLNLDYLPPLLVDVEPDYRDRGALMDLCQDSRVVRTFRDAGYRVVEYPGEYSLTRQRNADERRAPWLYFTEFEYMLVNRTPVQDLTSLVGLPQSWIPHQVRRNHLQFVMDGLAEGNADPGPTFTFAHIVAPHPPFVFEADGSYRREQTRAAFADGKTWIELAERFGENYAEGYVAQVEWLDSELPRVVDGILARSPDALIVIQGDHGPGSHLDWDSPTRSDLGERTSILLAARIPGVHSLPRGMTPVNTFRVVFGALFDTRLPLLPNRSYFSTWRAPYEFVDVTEAVAPK